MKMSNLHTIFMLGGGLLKKKDSKKLCPYIRSETAIKANFHFSHFKSMETLRCHSNQSANATAIKKTIFL